MVLSFKHGTIQKLLTLTLAFLRSDLIKKMHIFRIHWQWQHTIESEATYVLGCIVLAIEVGVLRVKEYSFHVHEPSC